MFKLLKVEWMKVKNYTTFWVLSGLYMVSVFGATYISHAIFISIKTSFTKKGGEEAKAFIGNAFGNPDIWQTVSYSSSLLMFMLGMLIIISVTNEYTYKTHRQNVIDGWSRKQFILVKILLTIIVAAVATFIVFITTIYFGIHENGSINFENIKYTCFFFIQALSYSAAGLLCSLLLKKPSICIGVFMLYSIVIEEIFVKFLNHYTDNLGRYLPLETTDNLIRPPVFKTIIAMATKSYNTELLLIMSVIYLVLYYLISYRKFETDDL